MKIACVFEGSRGDTQPYAVLAAGLQKAGHIVRYFTNCNLVSFIQTFDVDCRSCGFNFEDFLNTNEEIGTAMREGSFLKFIKAMNGDVMKRHFQNHVANYWKELDEFAPDLLIGGPLTIPICKAYEFKRNVPFQMVVLQNNTPTAGFGPPMLGLSLPAWTGLNLKIWRFALKQMHSTLVERQKLMVEALNEDLGWALDQQWFLDEMFDRDQIGTAPLIIGSSINFGTHRSDMPKKAHVVGWFVMDQEDQLTKAKEGAQIFGGGEHAELLQFLESGEPPVYIGWGSMVANSREHMTGLAVRALMRAGARGIIIAGWARLSLECLADEPDWRELKAYCDENVLFMKAAPHAFLFPRCACIVHHGGSGTTAASTMSGKPTIITPVFMDQWEYASLVNDKNVGVGFKHSLSKVSPSDLGLAIMKCCSDPQIRENAKNMGGLLAAEDGVTSAVGIIDGFLKEKVQTGIWRQEYELVREHYKPKTSRRCIP